MGKLGKFVEEGLIFKCRRCHDKISILLDMVIILFNCHTNISSDHLIWCFPIRLHFQEKYHVRRILESAKQEVESHNGVSSKQHSNLSLITQSDYSGKSYTSHHTQSSYSPSHSQYVTPRMPRSANNRHSIHDETSVWYINMIFILPLLNYSTILVNELYDRLHSWIIIPFFSILQHFFRGRPLTKGAGPNSDRNM